MFDDFNLPKISCLMVTAGGRDNLFLRSFQQYQDQTYTNKELVVVNEGPPEYQRFIRSQIAGRSDVKFIALQGEYTLGALRNISMLLCNGDLWVQWDDDDFNLPERLAVQFSFLVKHPEAKMCYLSDQLHYYFDRKQLYWENWLAFHSGSTKKWALIPGTGMAWRHQVQHRYPSAGSHARAGEDSVFACALLEQNERNVVLLSGMGYMQMYTFHGKNVWNVDHHLKISELRSQPVAHMLKHEDRIRKSIHYFNLEKPVQVMGREGVAFHVC